MSLSGNLPDPDVASRLCAACGICCDGTMFQAVNLQPEDSAKELRSLGLRLKHKKQKTFFTQSCTAFRGTYCGIYDRRPSRCRVFQCQQIDRVAAGEVTEAEALGTIQQARDDVAAVRELLVVCGSTNPRRSLAERYQAVLAQPIDVEREPSMAESRRQLQAAMEALEELLTGDFRQKPIGGVADETKSVISSE